VKTKRTLGAATLATAVALAVVTLVLLPMTVGCGGAAHAADTDGGDAKVVATSEDVAALVRGGNDFAFDLYGRLAGDGNLFFSPYSISTALAMTATGARGNTEREMATVLRYPKDVTSGASVFFSRERIAASFDSLQGGLRASPDESGYELNIANSLWGQEDYPFKETYIDLVAESFGGGFNPADFLGNAEAERVRINKWVEDETREKIKDLIPPGGVDSATTLVLTNAVYFKGRWELEFDKELTADAPFYGKYAHSSVPMMHRKGDFRYFESEIAQVLEMPYKGGDVSMLVVLPKPGMPRGLRLIDASLKADMLAQWSDGLRKQEVKVYFPRFEMTWGTEDVSGHLAALGILDAFSPRADFTGMTDLQELFIGPVFHKAFVKVNEEGTEAAAATAVVMKRLAIEHETVFRADRPFMFIIRDNDTGSILFMGRIEGLE